MCPQQQCVTRHLGHPERPQSIKMPNSVCPSCWTAQHGAELVGLILGAAAGLNTQGGFAGLGLPRTLLIFHMVLKRKAHPLQDFIIWGYLHTQGREIWFFFHLHGHYLDSGCPCTPHTAGAEVPVDGSVVERNLCAHSLTQDLLSHAGGGMMNNSPCQEQCGL